MDLKQIITARKRYSWPSWHLIYEWEDDIAKSLNIPFVNETNHCNLKLLQRLPFLEMILTRQRLSLYFCMNAKEYAVNKRFNMGRVIPCIVDFFLEAHELGSFYQNLAKSKLILISSKEVYDYLVEHHCPLNIAHFPLSLSDRYSITAQTKFEKKYDLVLMGRQNPVLKGFLDKYVEKHPEFVYVYRILKNGVFSYFTNTGEALGSDFDSREKYISLMQSARIGFYTTPGIDDKENRSKGFNQVTPRFLELISSGCHILARYPKNSDTEFYEIEKFSPSIDTYQQFESAINDALAKEVDMKLYADYLAKHYTSIRAEQLKNLVKTI